MAAEYPSRRIVVTGSRNWRGFRVIQEQLHYYLAEEQQFLLGVGDCPTGADDIALRWGRAWLDWPVTEFHAPWTRRKKAAGMIRNHFMIDLFRPCRVLAFLRPESRGTVDCANYAERKGIEVHRFFEGGTHAVDVQEDGA